MSVLNASARLAIAWPILPSPTIPTVLPDMDVDRGSDPERQRPTRTKTSPSTARRATFNIKNIATSAVSSVRISGVLVTVMSRLNAAAVSILSKPAPNWAIISKFGKASIKRSLTPLPSYVERMPWICAEFSRIINSGSLLSHRRRTLKLASISSISFESRGWSARIVFFMISPMKIIWMGIKLLIFCRFLWFMTLNKYTNKSNRV